MTETGLSPTLMPSCPGYGPSCGEHENIRAAENGAANFQRAPRNVSDEHLDRW